MGRTDNKAIQKLERLKKRVVARQYEYLKKGIERTVGFLHGKT